MTGKTILEVNKLTATVAGVEILKGIDLTVRAGDLVLRRNGWQGQHTDEEKPVDSPDNLVEPLPGDRGARGRFSAQARNSTLWTSLRLRRVLVGAAVAGVGLATMGITNSREKPLIR